jgi:hypothetical protein
VLFTGHNNVPFKATAPRKILALFFYVQCKDIVERVKKMRYEQFVNVE